MHLSPYSLRQLDQAYLDILDEAALRVLSGKLLEDLKEAWERLNQGPENSSRPPSSRAPWERKSGGREPDEDPEDGDREPEAAAAQPAEAKPEETPSGEVKPTEAKAVAVQPAAVQSARKAGKQPGAPGIGRTQVFQAHEEQRHYPDVCAGCGRVLERAGAVAYTGFQAVDLRWGDPGRGRG